MGEPAVVLRRQRVVLGIEVGHVDERADAGRAWVPEPAGDVSQRAEVEGAAVLERLGEQHAGDGVADQQLLEGRLVGRQRGMVDVAHGDARVVRRVPRRPARLAGERDPSLDGDVRRRIVRFALQEEPRLLGIAKELPVDGAPPRAPAVRDRVQRPAADLPPHEREWRPLVAEVGPTVSPVELGGELQAAGGVVAHRRDVHGGRCRRRRPHLPHRARSVVRPDCPSERARPGRLGRTGRGSGRGGRGPDAGDVVEDALRAHAASSLRAELDDERRGAGNGCVAELGGVAGAPAGAARDLVDRVADGGGVRRRAPRGWRRRAGWRGRSPGRRRGTRR